jgi:hypothetical protein
MFRSTRRLVALTLTVTMVVVGAPAGAETTAPGQQVAVLPFFSGFTPPTAISADLRRIVGTDGNTDANWDDMGGWVDHNGFQYLADPNNLRAFVNSEIIFMNGRLGTGTHVLRMTTFGDDPNFTSMTRNELSLYSKPPPNDFKEGFVRYWTMLPPDMATRIPTSRSSPWWVFMEWKEPDSGIAWDATRCAPLGETAGGTNNYRINVNIERDAGSSQFYWRIIAEQVQPCRKVEWEWINRTAPVPMNGEWFMVQAYLKKDASAGRVYFAVYTPELGSPRVVLDTDVTRPPGFTGRTQHATNPLPLAFWSPLKLYHHQDWWDAGPTTQLYDEFYLSNTIPPN